MGWMIGTRSLKISRSLSAMSENHSIHSVVMLLVIAPCNRLRSLGWLGQDVQYCAINLQMPFPTILTSLGCPISTLISCWRDYALRFRHKCSDRNRSHSAMPSTGLHLFIWNGSTAMKPSWLFLRFGSGGLV